MKYTRKLLLTPQKQYNAIAVEGWYHKLIPRIAEQKRKPQKKN